jgi:hypothetical protein
METTKLHLVSFDGKTQALIDQLGITWLDFPDSTAPIGGDFLNFTAADGVEHRFIFLQRAFDVSHDRAEVMYSILIHT